MFGATSEKGKLVSGISIILYILVMTLKNVPIDKSVLALSVAGIGMVVGSVYYKYLKKELCILWGVSTWIYGVIFLMLSIFQLSK